MGANRYLTVPCLVLTAVALSGCLAGERPPITTLYPDPTSQAPIISGQVPLVAGSGTRVERYEFYGAPGTTFRYGEIPTQPAYPYPYGYGRYPDPRGPVYDRRLPPGPPRYTYLGSEIRCDNLDRSCARWSGRQGVFVPDYAATRQVYGDTVLGTPYRRP